MAKEKTTEVAAADVAAILTKAEALTPEEQEALKGYIDSVTTENSELKTENAKLGKELKALKKTAPEATTPELKKLSREERVIPFGGKKFLLADITTLKIGGRIVTAADIIADGSLHGPLITNKSPLISEVV